MTESTVQILLWMLAFAAVGLIFGWILGLMFSRRRYAEEKVEYLHDQLKHVGGPVLERRLRQMHSTLNDAHKHILALAKYINPD